MDDCLDELVSTEHLTSFSVVEYFCESCGDLTPHHINEAKEQAPVASNSVVSVPPLSLHECVYCREEEESMLSEFNS